MEQVQELQELERLCRVCNGPVPKPRRGPIGMYCGDACKQRAYRLRQSQAKRAAQVEAERLWRLSQQRRSNQKARNKKKRK